jgi:hypothetical protein
MPAGIHQGVSSIFVILFAPLFTALWIGLGRRGKNPSTPVKFAAGLILMGLGFLVMYVASMRVIGGHRVLPTWLVLCYLVQMWGDLPGPGGAFLHDQARGTSLRRAGDGDVVSVDRPRQQSRRAAGD